MIAKNMFNSIPQLNFSKMQTYLNKTGWISIETGKPTIALFQKVVSKDFYEILLPLSNHFADYKIRTFEALETIGRVEGREIEKVLSDIGV